MKSFTHIFGLLGMAAFLVGCGGSSPFAPTTNPTGGGAPPPPPPSPGTSAALALNDAGFIVGSGTNATDTRAVMFVTGGNQPATGYTVVDIGDFAGGGGTTKVNGINASGNATGFSVSATVAHAYLYVGTTNTLTDIGALGGVGISNGRALTDDNQIVGESGSGPNSQPYHWDAVNGIQYVADPLGTTQSGMTGINSSGLMVGVYNDGLTDDQPFDSTLAGPAVDLSGVLTPGFPHGINNSGVIVGDSGGNSGAWKLNTVGNIVTNLPCNGPVTCVAINSGGECVGSDLIGGKVHAVQWVGGSKSDLGLRGDANVVDLNTLIAPGALKLNDYLEQATGINSSGQICCNTHLNRAVILTPVVSGGIRGFKKRSTR